MGTLTISLGPVLGFRSSTPTRWQYCVLYVFEGFGGGHPPHLPDLQWSAETALPTKIRIQGKSIYIHKTFSVVVYELDIPLQATPSSVTYQLVEAKSKNAIDPSHSFFIPEKNTTPRIAYASCNGFEQSISANQLTNDAENRWEHLNQEHRQDPFQLLVMGGDQIYSDSVWDSVHDLMIWAKQSRSFQVSATFTPSMEATLREQFFKLYISHWSSPQIANAFASIPTLMMWDDHDITDGWGSHPDELQACPVFQGLFGIAREFFMCFQQRLTKSKAVPTSFMPAPAGAVAPSNFSALHCMGDIALWTADLRSERTRKQIMSSASWARAEAALRALPKEGRIKHLVMLSSIPLIFPTGGRLADVVTGLDAWEPLNDSQDDLIDQWSNYRHHAEREQLVRLLFNVAEKNIRVTIVAGDVHVAAQGIIQDQRAGAPQSSASTITQLISSAIVHPAQSRGISIGISALAATQIHDIYRDVKGWLVPFATGKAYLINKRNWLSLKPQADHALLAQWHFEDLDAVFIKTIGAC